tara:strand:+ start:188 stop:658 length:471 start_codon:yes stop_codon:yes gene_type:complete
MVSVAICSSCTVEDEAEVDNTSTTTTTTPVEETTIVGDWNLTTSVTEIWSYSSLIGSKEATKITSYVYSLKTDGTFTNTYEFVSKDVDTAGNIAEVAQKDIVEGVYAYDSSSKTLSTTQNGTSFSSTVELTATTLKTTTVSGSTLLSTTTVNTYTK